MAWSWVGVPALVLVLAGCGGDQESPGNATREDDARVKSAVIGGPPTVPPAPVEGVEARQPRPTVVAAGQTARGDAFELVFYGMGRGLCIATLLPERHSDTGGACGERLVPRLSSPIMATGSATFGRNEHELSGFVSRETERVELTFELEGDVESMDAVTEQLSPKLLEQVGRGRPIGVFVSFLPEGVTAGDVTATAHAAGGDSLGTAEWLVPDGDLTGLSSAAIGRAGADENQKVASRIAQLDRRPASRARSPITATWPLVHWR